MSDALAIFRFYLASTLIVLFTLPLCWLVFPRSSRHLLLYGRILGLLLTNFTVFFLAGIGLLHFSGIGIWIAMLLLLGTGASIWKVRGLSLSRVKSWFSSHWHSLLFDEVVFLAAFILFALFIAHHPRIIGTEKNMDFAFLNSLMRGESIPPLDPWFARGTINYYYGGYMIVALLGRLSGLPPAFTYNLALAFLFASGVALSWALGQQLSGSRIRGALAPLTILIMGNLDGFLQVLQVGKPYLINYFDSSRVIVDGTGAQTGNTINEFPFFSFYHADMHPHVMSIPFVLIFIALLYEFLLVFRPRMFFKNRVELAGRVFILAMAVGSLGFINGLDLPSFGLLFAGVVFFAFLRSFGVRNEKGGILPLRILLAFGVAVAVAGISGLMGNLLHLAFYANFIAPTHPQGLLGWSEYRSNPGEFLTVFHLQMFLLALYLIVQYTLVSRNSQPVIFRLLLLVLAALFIFFFAVQGYIVAALLIVLLPMTAYTVFRNLRRPDDLFLALMLTLAVAILMGCEFVHVRDDYGKLLQRMNTLFKFHYHAWILLGLSAPMIWTLLKRPGSLDPSLRGLFKAILAILLLLNLVYPFGVSWARLRQPREGLNGMAYLDNEHPGDAAAIKWFNENVQGTPVVLEYPGKRAYSYDARISTNTGLPTLVGWINHEAIWRKKWIKKNPAAAGQPEKGVQSADSWGMAGLRQSAADRIYQEPTFAPIVPLLRQYKIEYIYVGELEKQNYPAQSLSKFSVSCERVFSRFGAEIYRVPPEAISSGQS